MSKEDKYQGVFSRGNGYSSTKYAQLVSTTYSFGYEHYCLHCHNKAKPIQANIVNFNDYKTTGYRCTCELAIKEISELLAHEIGDFKFIKINDNHSISKERYIELISNLRSDSLPVCSDSNNRLPDVVFSKGERDNLSFFLDYNKRDIKNSLTDSYLRDIELGLLMTAVAAKLKELIKEEIKCHEDSINALDDLKSYFDI